MIDPAKKYRTRDGREVRIYAVDAKGKWPIHGATRYGDNDCWTIREWHENGMTPSSLGNHELDLIEVKPRIQREVWVNVYPNGNLCYHDSREKADGAGKCCGRIACVKLVIDCEEGEGL
jgi:hypothetical protein